MPRVPFRCIIISATIWSFENTTWPFQTPGSHLPCFLVCIFILQFHFHSSHSVHSISIHHFCQHLIISGLIFALKGTVSRNFRLHVFSWISSPPPQSIPLGPFRVFSRWYSKSKMQHRFRWHRWQIKKIFSHKIIKTNLTALSSTVEPT